MFDIGLSEILVAFLVAIFLFKPSRLIELLEDAKNLLPSIIKIISEIKSLVYTNKEIEFDDNSILDESDNKFIIDLEGKSRKVYTLSDIFPDLSDNLNDKSSYDHLEEETDTRSKTLH